jgi:uncharacterized protein YqkB
VSTSNIVWYNDYDSLFTQDEKATLQKRQQAKSLLSRSLLSVLASNMVLAASDQGKSQAQSLGVR